MSAVRVTTTTLLATALLTPLLTMAGCGQGSDTDPGGSVTPTSSDSSPGGSGSDDTEAPADLTIVVDDGKGAKTTWHLACAPSGGDHPNPDNACAVLAKHGRTALAAVPRDQMCTQVYGGPQTAHITGTWQGKPVDLRLSRTDGCQIARWDALAGLLPAARA
jgi:hypothetical protein